MSVGVGRGLAPFAETRFSGNRREFTEALLIMKPAKYVRWCSTGRAY